MSALTVVKKFFPKVKSVVDATKPADIRVTPKDAASKAVKDHVACAMAVACKRKFHLDGVIISRTTAYLIKGKQARRFQVPNSVSREVVSFDRGGGFAPGRYRLIPFSPTRRLGVKAPGTDSFKTDKPKPAESRFRHITANVRTILGGQHPETESASDQ